MTVHKFGPQLAYSAKLSDEPSWDAFYRRVWSDMVSSHRLDGANQWQRDGVDRIVYLPNRKEIRIDEKKRTKDYGDILLEEWSVFYGEGDRRNKIGWALDANKVCDFIAYAVIPAQRCYLLPFEILRLAFAVNRDEWVRKYRKPPAQNDGYQTINVALKWNVLYPEMVRQMLRSFGSGAIAVGPPAPVVAQAQLELQPVGVLTEKDIPW